MRIYLLLIILFSFENPLKTQVTPKEGTEPGKKEEPIIPPGNSSSKSCCPNFWYATGSSGIVDENSIGKINLGRVSPPLLENSNPNSSPNEINSRKFGWEDVSAHINPIVPAGEYSIRYPISPFEAPKNDQTALELGVYFKIPNPETDRLIILLKKWNTEFQNHANQTEIIAYLNLHSESASKIDYQFQKTRVHELLDFSKNIYFVEAILKTSRKPLDPSLQFLQNGEILGPSLGALSLTSINSENLENFDASNVPACSDRDIKTYRKIVDHYQGIEGIDPGGHNIGSFAALHNSKLVDEIEGAITGCIIGFFLGGIVGCVTHATLDVANEKTIDVEIVDIDCGLNWIPLSNQKEILCGNIDVFKTFNGYGDEMDWNIHILPKEGLPGEDGFFDWMVEEALRFKFDVNEDICHTGFDIVADGGLDWFEGKTNGEFLIEAEITPDEKWYNNPWFPKGGKSPLVDEEVCFYGPFVREYVHGNRPEIHPCEQVWWYEEEKNEYFILFLNDDSNRFHNHEFFAKGETSRFPKTTITGIASPGYKTWTREKNHSGKFRIAFELDPETEQQLFEIRIPGDNVHEISNVTVAYPDADNGKEHGIEYKGKVVLKVTEPTIIQDTLLGVNFEDICFNGITGKLQGYITLSVSVGNGGGKEGFVAFRIRKSDTFEVQKSSDIPLERQVSIDMKYQDGSLKLKDEAGKKSLHADFEFTNLLLPKNVKKADFSLLKIQNKTTAQSQAFFKKQSFREGEGFAELKNLGLSPAQEVVLLAETSHKNFEFRIPTMSLSGKLTGQHKKSMHKNESWQAIINGLPRKRTRKYYRNFLDYFGKPYTLDTIEFEFTPYYITGQNESLEIDGNAITEELNETLQIKNTKRLLEIYGSNEPFEISWNFTITDEKSEKLIPSDSFFIQVTQGMWANSKVQLIIPEKYKNDILKIEVKPEIKDLFGHNCYSPTFIYWNQICSLKDYTLDNVLISPFEYYKYTKWKKETNPSTSDLIPHPIELENKEFRQRLEYFGRDNYFNMIELLEIF